MNFADFILLHDADDPGRLALSRDRLSRETEDFDLALSTLESRRKLRGKVPEWVAVSSLRYPLRLAAEQCSSSETAFYKASLLGGAACVVDLTGGLGVDSWAFSRHTEKVLYNEMNPVLARAAGFNFRELGAENIIVRNKELKAGCLAEILDGFSPDVVYLDPARRAADGRKVFRLEDCQPDVLSLLPELLEACPRLLLKLSPMADITLVCKQLGCVKQVHVVAAGGECKELLLLLEKGYEGAYKLFVVEDGAVKEIPGQAGDDGWVKVDGQAGNNGVVMAGPDRPSPCFLFEPGKALLKAGAFDWPCRFGLSKLGRHTHLYIGPETVRELTPFGKWFQVLDVLPLNKRSLKDVASRYPQADVTARNIPLTSDELRARLKVRPGNGIHIFGLHEDASSANLLMVTEVA